MDTPTIEDEDWTVVNARLRHEDGWIGEAPLGIPRAVVEAEAEIALAGLFATLEDHDEVDLDDFVSVVFEFEDRQHLVVEIGGAHRRLETWPAPPSTVGEVWPERGFRPVGWILDAEETTEEHFERMLRRVKDPTVHQSGAAVWIIDDARIEGVEKVWTAR